MSAADAGPNFRVYSIFRRSAFALKAGNFDP